MINIPFFRFSSISLFFAGLFTIVGWGLDSIDFSVLGRALVFISNPLLVFGLMGLFFLFTHENKKLGQSGFIIAVFGNILMTAVSFLTLTLISGQNEALIIIQSTGGKMIQGIAGLALTIGYVLTGIAIIKNVKFKNYEGVLMILGIIFLFLGAGLKLSMILSAIGGILFGIDLLVISKKMFITCKSN